jgi:prevent-host-death family protein
MPAVEQMPLVEVRNRLSEVVDRLEREHGRVVITKRGRPAAVMLSLEDLESLQETLAVLSDPELVAARRMRAPMTRPFTIWRGMISRDRGQADGHVDGEALELGAGGQPLIGVELQAVGQLVGVHVEQAEDQLDGDEAGPVDEPQQRHLAGSMASARAAPNPCCSSRLRIPPQL